MPPNPDLPRPSSVKISKADLLQELKAIDACESSRSQVLLLESEFRKRIGGHVASLPSAASLFSKFNTSPFVLMFYARQRGYTRICEIEGDILPAKLFSSMETSAGKMVQDVVLPLYGWEDVPSTMHSVASILDGRRREPDTLKLATLKSGPRCLNDEMSKDLADDIVGHAEQWAEEAKVDHVEFSYGALYGTPRQSNKKDWHILRNIVETIGERFIIEHPRQCWKCSFRIRGIRVDATVRIGTEWWTYLGDRLTLSVVLCALIRACVSPSTMNDETTNYTITDLAEIVSVKSVPPDFNVSLLQHSQLPWFFFLHRHYCDEIVE